MGDTVKVCQKCGSAFRGRHQCSFEGRSTPIPDGATTDQILLLNLLHNQMAILDAMKAQARISKVLAERLDNRWMATNRLVF